MNQTLLCLAAVVVFALFGVTRHRTLAADEQAEARREAEAATLATAERWAATIADASFDQADVTRTTLRLSNDTADLAAAATEFGVHDPGETTAADFDDVDDYDDLDVSETARAAMGVLPVRVRVEVAYVALQADGTFAESPTPTTTKAATITVTEASATGRTPAHATLTVRVTPAGQFLHS